MLMLLFHTACFSRCGPLCPSSFFKLFLRISFLIPFFCICICLVLHVWGYTYAHEHVCLCMWRPDADLGNHPDLCSTLVIEAGALNQT